MLSKRNKELHKEVMAHWRRFLKALQSGDIGAMQMEGHYATQCAFCDEYLVMGSGGISTCAGCPVATETGEAACFGSPWYAADKAICEYYLAPDDSELQALAIEAVETQVEFLGALDDAD